MSVRFLDSLHTSMGVVANWKYLIQHYGDELETDHINWCATVQAPRVLYQLLMITYRSVSMTVALTVRALKLWLLDSG